MKTHSNKQMNLQLTGLGWKRGGKRWCWCLQAYGLPLGGNRRHLRRTRHQEDCIGTDEFRDKWRTRGPGVCLFVFSICRQRIESAIKIENRQKKKGKAKTKIEIAIEIEIEICRNWKRRQAACAENGKTSEMKWELCECKGTNKCKEGLSEWEDNGMLPLCCSCSCCAYIIIPMRRCRA